MRARGWWWSAAFLWVVVVFSGLCWETDFTNIVLLFFYTGRGGSKGHPCPVEPKSSILGRFTLVKQHKVSKITVSSQYPLKTTTTHKKAADHHHPRALKKLPPISLPQKVIPINKEKHPYYLFCNKDSDPSQIAKEKEALIDQGYLVITIIEGENAPEKGLLEVIRNHLD